jgi:hypothetical protein
MVNKTIYYEDGSYDVVRSYTNASTIEVWKSGTKETMACGWNPDRRTYHDTTTDADLKVRTGFLLTNRFLSPLPNCNIGVSTPGFLIGALSGRHDIYYCQTGRESLAGYYHEGWQTTHVDDAVIDLSAFDSTIVGYCKEGWGFFDLSSTRLINSDSNEQQRVAPLGYLPIAYFTSFKYNKTDGILCRGAFKKTRKKIDFVITDKRGVVTHDGMQMGENILAGRVMQFMEKCQAIAALHYDERSGLILWLTERLSQ